MRFVYHVEYVLYYVVLIACKVCKICYVCIVALMIKHYLFTAKLQYITAVKNIYVTSSQDI